MSDRQLEKCRFFKYRHSNVEYRKDVILVRHRVLIIENGVLKPTYQLIFVSDINVFV